MLIKTLQDLAEELDVVSSKEPLIQIIQKTVFRSTQCGCTFNCTPTGVSVSGYCEGSDNELPVHTLTYPFAASAFWSALDEADAEGDNEWDYTHGCPECYPPEYIRGECPVNPHCRRCNGDGEVI